MKKNPNISIVIPSYNKEKYIKKTLDSIVSQSYKNYEVIIQDGGSTDGSVKIIKQYAKKNKKIKWESRKDKGQLDAINKGLRKATGDILTFINADDVYKKNAFQQVADCYKNNPNTIWFAGRGDIINKNGKQIQKAVTIYKNILQKINYYPLLLTVNYLTQPSVFISRKAYKKYGPFTGTKNYVMEYEMWLKLGKVQMPTLIDQTISSFRLFIGNKSTIYFDELLRLDYKIASKFTNSKVLMFLHKLNNMARVKMAKSGTI